MNYLITLRKYSIIGTIIIKIRELLQKVHNFLATLTKTKLLLFEL